MKNEWIKFTSLLKRNIKLYFADKTVFFVSLMSPMILLLLFVLFLRGVYVNSLLSMLPEGIVFAAENTVDAFVAGWLISSILSVSCVTVSIGACIIMVQDKIKGRLSDFNASPVKSGTVVLSYFFATFVSALIIMLTVLGLGFIYIAVSGWYLSFGDVLLILLCAVLLTLFGCGLATVINSFIRSDGGVTAVSALSSSVYGFICGAYMPLSQFGAAFSNICGFNPGLYGSILFKRLFLGGVLEEMSAALPSNAVGAIKDGFDFNFYMFGVKVLTPDLWIILSVSIVLLAGVIALITARKKR